LPAAAFALPASLSTRPDFFSGIVVLLGGSGDRRVLPATHRHKRGRAMTMVTLGGQRSHH
jgi:hypothetical protein